MGLNLHVQGCEKGESFGVRGECLLPNQFGCYKIFSSSATAASPPRRRLNLERWKDVAI